MGAGLQCKSEQNYTGNSVALSHHNLPDDFHPWRHKLSTGTIKFGLNPCQQCCSTPDPSSNRCNNKNKTLLDLTNIYFFHPKANRFCRIDNIEYLEMSLCRVVVCFCEGRTVRGLLAAIRANQLEGLFHIMGRLVAADTCHVASLWHVSIDLVMTRVTWPRLVTIFFSFCSFLSLLLLRSFIISVTNVIQI